MEATVFTDSDGKKHEFEHQNMEALFSNINDFIMDGYLYDENIHVSLADGAEYWWNHSFARYHYGKGRISFNEMLKFMRGGIQ